MSEPQFLPGVPETHVLARLAEAGGKEIESGKLSSQESSAALAVNCFGWLTEQPEQLQPVLFYLFAEPLARNDHPIAPDDLARHRHEIARFAECVAGDEVAFHSASYREWLGRWRQLDNDIATHADAILKFFKP